MKRLVRVTLKLVATPVVVFVQFWMLCTGLAWVFYDWVNEKEDPYYSNRQMLRYFANEYKNYWRGILR